MGIHEAMDIRGIAWAGYFFDPGALVPIDKPVFIRPPELEGEQVGEVNVILRDVKPGMGYEDKEIKPEPVEVESKEPDIIDLEDIKPDMKAD